MSWSLSLLTVMRNRTLIEFDVYLHENYLKSSFTQSSFILVCWQFIGMTVGLLSVEH